MGPVLLNDGMPMIEDFLTTGADEGGGSRAGVTALGRSPDGLRGPLGSRHLGRTGGGLYSEERHSY